VAAEVIDTSFCDVNRADAKRRFMANRRRFSGGRGIGAYVDLADEHIANRRDPDLRVRPNSCRSAHR
jgi:hypothetical protein